MPGRPSKAGTESASIFYLALSSTRLVSELLDLDAATVLASTQVQALAFLRDCGRTDVHFVLCSEKVCLACGCRCNADR